MVDDFANGIEATGSGAGVVAFVVPSAGKCSVAVRVDNTLGSAPSVGVSKVLWPAGALATSSANLRVSIRSTGVGVAGVPWRWWSWGEENMRT